MPSVPYGPERAKSCKPADKGPQLPFPSAQARSVALVVPNRPFAVPPTLPSGQAPMKSAISESQWRSRPLIYACPGRQLKSFARRPFKALTATRTVLARPELNRCRFASQRRASVTPVPGACRREILGTPRLHPSPRPIRDPRPHFAGARVLLTSPARRPSLGGGQLPLQRPLPSPRGRRPGPGPRPGGLGPGLLPGRMGQGMLTARPGRRTSRASQTAPREPAA